MMLMDQTVKQAHDSGVQWGQTLTKILPWCWVIVHVHLICVPFLAKSISLKTIAFCFVGYPPFILVSALKLHCHFIDEKTPTKKNR